MTPLDDNNPILLFDGVCNFCNSWVNFIIRHDKKNKFRFSTLQSETGKKLLKEYKISEKDDTAVLIFKGKAYIKSSMGLHVLYHIGGVYSIPFIFVLVPEYIRDFYYEIIARNRYKWWGKENECMIPTPEVKNKFL